MKKNRMWIYVLLFLIFIIGIWVTGLYTDWLWFQNLGYEAVFMKVFLSRWGVRLAAWLLFFLFLYINLLFTRKALLVSLNSGLKGKLALSGLGRFLTPGKITLFFLVACLVASFFFSAYMGSMWMPVQQFIQGVEFGIDDPIFQKDASFYIFQLPFWRILYTYLQTMIILTLLITGIIYFLSNPAVEVGNRLSFIPQRGQGHLSFLLALSFLLKVWDYRLKMYELLLSPGGVTFGPGYTDLNARLPALWILLFLTAAIVAMLVFNVFRRQPRLILISIGLLVGASLLVGSIYPGLVQQFRVSPNEFVLERQFLEHNIAMTRKAFGLDNMHAEMYPASTELSWDGLEDDGGTLDNVRLWDYRPLRQTYNQLQGIKPYYEFVDVDTDRYTVDGEYKQVMLSARELNQGRLPSQAQTWVNLRLQYTHGYGLAMNPVARVTSQGLPVFTIQGIPPALSGGLELNRPEIYYGEISSDYVVVNTKTQEFNYPVGDTNAFTHYEGKGGVLLNSFGRRLLYALKFSDYNLLLSGEITPESRIMFNRRILPRVSALAPFLRYDDDPYLVLYEGRLFWVLDAYTVTDNFPYSQPYGGVNYMRNSVKAVIDAYHGDVDFYITDPGDPMIRTYSGIFPALFKEMETMPEDIFRHLRYPETLLSTQARVFSTYHMTDPNVFYNREDLWQIPNEKYGDSTQAMEPYYSILQLPGEEEPELLLVLPFTPSSRDNMIAWMAGRSDGDSYGELLVYLFPKERVVFGPMQIETRIDQDTLISEQLSLWDQRGSHVLRGNLLVLPVDDSILYVEPVFLQAEQSELPELARVIVGFQETVVMEPTLEEALLSIFGARESKVGEEPAEGTGPGLPGAEDPGIVEPGKEPEGPSTVPDLARRAQVLFRQAQESQKQGDWAGYGRFLTELEGILEELVRMSGSND